MTLYELTDGYASLLGMYDAAETPEEREEILDMLAGVEGDISDKAEAYTRIIRNKLAEAEALKAEADRLTAKRRAAERVAERMKEAITDAMMRTGTQEIPTTIGKWRMTMNPWSCDVLDAEQVPEEWRIPQPDKVDKAGLLAHFKATGELVAGVEFKQTSGARFR